jgi:hypothetical protein
MNRGRTQIGTMYTLGLTTGLTRSISYVVNRVAASMVILILKIFQPGVTLEATCSPCAEIERRLLLADRKPGSWLFPSITEDSMGKVVDKPDLKVVGLWRIVDWDWGRVTRGDENGRIGTLSPNLVQGANFLTKYDVEEYGRCFFLDRNVSPKSDQIVERLCGPEPEKLAVEIKSADRTSAACPCARGMRGGFLAHL